MPTARRRPTKTVDVRSLFDALDAPNPPLRAMTLASSSAGNCTFVQAGETCLLVDAGIGVKRIEAGLGTLGIPLFHLTAIFITHSHGDHIGGLGPLLERVDAPVFATAPTLAAIEKRLGKLRRSQVVAPLESYVAGQIDVMPFRTSHDVPGSCAFLMSAGGRHFGVLTDSGIATPDACQLVANADSLLLETNHDVHMLLSGRYPMAQKRRIKGDKGHLSNADAAELLVNHATPRLKRVLCAHLSKDNNTPAIAQSTLQSALARTAHLRHVEVEIAPRDRPSSLFEI